jgi:hypothetical protein
MRIIHKICSSRTSRGEITAEGEEGKERKRKRYLYCGRSNVPRKGVSLGNCFISSFAAPLIRRIWNLVRMRIMILLLNE